LHSFHALRKNPKPLVSKSCVGRNNSRPGGGEGKWIRGFQNYIKDSARLYRNPPTKKSENNRKGFHIRD
jgi:hypothetical protein